MARKGGRGAKIGPFKESPEKTPGGGNGCQKGEKLPAVEKGAEKQPPKVAVFCHFSTGNSIHASYTGRYGRLTSLVLYVMYVLLRALLQTLK
jgi:hypothetical protein